MRQLPSDGSKAPNLFFEIGSIFIVNPEGGTPIVFYHPLWPLSPGLEDTCQYCFVNLTENFSHHLQEV
jgi:hypothetical protein